MDDTFKKYLESYVNHRKAVLKKQKDFLAIDNKLKNFLKEYPEPELIELYEEKYSLDDMKKLCEKIKSDWHKCLVGGTVTKTKIKKLYRVDAEYQGNNEYRYVCRFIKTKKKQYFYENDSYYCLMKRNLIIEMYDKRYYCETLENAKKVWLKSFESQINHYQKELEKVKKLEAKNEKSRV